MWALGSCLYSLAFLQNCFEEGSNLAILSRNYKIPDDNPYGEDLAELIDRMLTMNCKERADMTEVILCLSAIYSGRQLPPRKRFSRVEKGEEYKNAKKKERVGTYRTDGQGIRKAKSEGKKPAEAKKLNPNSAAARRRKAAQTSAENTAIPLTRQSSKIRKPPTSSTDFDQSFSDGFTFRNDNGGSEFSGVNYPFHVGESKFFIIIFFFRHLACFTDKSDKQLLAKVISTTYPKMIFLTFLQKMAVASITLDLMMVQG